MCCWRRVAVARVFALVVRCGIMMLFVYSRVGKNRDTRRESPAGAGAGRTADHLTVLFSQKILAVRSANDIYRPVSGRYLFSLFKNFKIQIFYYCPSWLFDGIYSFTLYGRGIIVILLGNYICIPEFILTRRLSCFNNFI